MLTEKQILTAYTLKRQGKAYREIAQTVGLDGKTQHSQVVTALRYYVMGYQTAMRKTQAAAVREGSPWFGRLVAFCAGQALMIILAVITFMW